MNDATATARIHQLIGRLSKKLTAGKKAFCTAESCTGGLVAALCTEVPGSSEWFTGGVVAYDNSVKAGLLGVPKEALERYGAVSEVVVRAMAEGALKAVGADLAAAVSGIAGPSGGSPEKPVGTVHIAAALRRGGKAGNSKTVVVAAAHHFSGDRQSVRFQAAEAALEAAAGLLEREETAE